MNVVRVYGGLGNQLFQYAFGKAQTHIGTSVAYNISWYLKPRDPVRLFLLDKFHTKVEKQSFLNQKTYKENNYDSSLLKLKNCNFFGYWQSPLYFESIKSILREEIQVKEEYYTDDFTTLKNKIESENALSIHVRHGDYLSNSSHVVLSMEYYKKALDFLLKTQNIDSIYVFSDHIDWCKERFDANFISIEEDFLEFELMRCCKFNIIANSTFSWWAAYLNGNPDKKVIFPKEMWIKRENDNWLKF